MKIFRRFLWLTMLLSSCNAGEEILFPKTTFVGPFPKRNLDLTTILGSNLTIKSGKDTLTLTIHAFKNYNFILNSKTGDTVFKGTACKYRGLYYFNQQLNDTSYWIYAVKLSDNLLYGLKTAREQTLLIDRAIENGQYKKLIRYRGAENIRLYPDKRELKNLFASITDSIQPDTIIQFHNAAQAFADTTRTIYPVDPEDFEYLAKVYPNPATHFVNIELQQKNKLIYQLTDIRGKAVLQAQFTETENRIDISRLPSGIYYLTLINQAGNQKETVKIIKIK